MFFDYLDLQQTENIKKYKYNGIDTSPLSKYVTKPFWRWLADNYPLWLSPNILTLLSLGVLFLGYFVIEIYDQNFCLLTYQSQYFSPIPAWVWLLASLCTFLSHTLDGTDGMQARRLGISSPLGELLDHGCDSVSAFLIFMFVLSSLYICGPNGGVSLQRLVLNMSSILFLFYLSHWEKYLTGALFLPWAYDPSFLGLTLFLIFLPFLQPLKVLDFVSPSLSFFQLVEVIYQLAIWLVSVPTCLYNIYSSYAHGTGKMRSFGDAMRPLSTILIFNLIFAGFFFFPSDIILLHPKYVLWMYGIVSSNIVSRLIVAQMCDSPAPITNSSFVPLLGLLFVTFIDSFDVFLGYIELEKWLLPVFVCGLTVWHFYYFGSVIRQLMRVLDVPFFTVPKRKYV